MSKKIEQPKTKLAYAKIAVGKPIEFLEVKKK